jgi:hypothetical protein
MAFADNGGQAGKERVGWHNGSLAEVRGAAGP